MKVSNERYSNSNFMNSDVSRNHDLKISHQQSQMKGSILTRQRNADEQSQMASSQIEKPEKGMPLERSRSVKIRDMIN